MPFADEEDNEDDGSGKNLTKALKENPERAKNINTIVDVTKDEINNYCEVV